MPKTREPEIARWPHVRFGSKAEMCAAISHARFTPESGHLQRTGACPLSARSGHEQPLLATSSTRRRKTCLQHSRFASILKYYETPRNKALAEREGFEPPIPLRVCRISSAVLSTTQPPLRRPNGPEKARIDGAM